MSDSAKPSRNSEVQALRGILPDEELEIVHAYWMRQGADPGLAQSADDALIAVLREAGDGLVELGRMDSAFERLAEDIAQRTAEIRSGLSSTDAGKTLVTSQFDGPTTAEPVPLAERDSAVIGPAPTKTLAEASRPSVSAGHAAASSEATFLSSPAADDGVNPKLTVRDGRLATPTDEELVPGFQLGAYRIVRRLGQGGMGSVFLAEHIRMERLVALKTLASDMTRDPQALKRFHREVKAAAKLSHPNIVTAYDADEAQGLQMLIMEYVEGTDLSVRVKRDGTMSVQETLHSLLQAARGLEFAHSKGVVHRDIKPANLLIDRDGVVKVLDMGLARIGEAEESATAGLTTAGTIMGTAEFMAPEQALDTRTADARADIYSLGCTLYYLLTGHAPYTGDTVMKILLAHRDRAVPKLRAVRTDVPERLDSLFQRMVAKRVPDRCQTMTEVISELEAIQAELARGNASRSGDSAVTLPGSIEFPEIVRLSTPSSSAVASPPTPAVKRVIPPRWTRSPGLVAAASAGLLFLFGLVITLTTREGTLVLEVTEPNTKIEIDEELLKVQVTRADGRETITIGVEPGTHQLKVQKDGFALYTTAFEIGWGGTKSLKAELKPLNAKPETELSSTVPGPGPSAAPTGTTVGEWDTPEFRKWLAEVNGLPAEKLLEAVSKKLMELNPGFDGKLAHGWGSVPGATPVIHRGKVVEVGYSSAHVTNIAPLRAFGTLRGLSCLGPSEGSIRGELVDLSPLRGMEIERFCADRNPLLRDVSPVVGPRLKELQIGETGVTDLSPLRGSAVTSLNMAFSGVTDIRPLAGLPLETLSLGYYGTEGGVTDLSPLQGMPLKQLSLRTNRGLTDISGLAGLPLTSLDLLETGVESLEPLRGMRLTTIAISATKVSDMSPLQAMPLKVIGLDFDAARDTQWLRSIKTLENINDKPAAEFWKEVAAMSATSPKPTVPQPDAGKHDWDTPEFRQWLAKVKDLPAEELLEAVSKKMVELNPGFDGKLSHGFSHIPGSTPVIERGKVVEVGFSSPVVSNVAPLRAFGTLRSVSCAGSSSPAEQPSLLVDISPLRGMEIERFCGFWNKGLRDYTPVVGPQLRELLLVDTEATDLSPLRGIPLRRLNVSFNGVEDLRPLEGMPLEQLGIAGHFDNRPGIRDLSPLKGMQLKSLFVSQNPRLADLSPLAGMPLDEFIALGTGIQSLEPLRGMNIRSLGLSRTRVSDLSPLEGMPLQVLEISETPVRDLSPLRGLPLDELQIAGCRQLSDFSALTEIALKRVFLDFDAKRDTDWLRSIKTLEIINGKPVAEFWKEVASESAR